MERLLKSIRDKSKAFTGKKSPALRWDVISETIVKKATQRAQNIRDTTLPQFYEAIFGVPYTDMSLAEIVKRMRPDDASRHAVCFRPAFLENRLSETSCSLIAALLILQATKKIRVSAYHLTSHRITDALCYAKLKKNLDIEVYIDNQSMNSNSRAAVLKMYLCDISVFVNCQLKIHHDKVILLDEMCLLTGSYNFADRAENVNFENYIVTLDADLVEAYEERLKNVKSVSTPFEFRLHNNRTKYILRCVSKK